MMKIFQAERSMYMLVLSISILIIASSSIGAFAGSSVIMNALHSRQNEKFLGNASQEQLQDADVNVAFVISAWQYYSRGIIATINQSLTKLTINMTSFNFSIIVVEGSTTRTVLENLLSVAKSIVQNDTFDYVVFFVAPWEDTQLRYEFSQLESENKLKTKIVFFDSMRPFNSRKYLSYYGFADEELAFMAGSISAYLASKMSIDVDEIAFYTNLPDIGPPNQKQGGIPEWHDFVTDISVTGFIQGVLYYNQQFDVTSLPLFADLDQIFDSNYIDQVAARIVDQMQSGQLRLVAIRAPYNLTNAIVSLLSSATNDSMLVVLDHDVTLSHAVPFSLPKNHTFLLQKLLDAIWKDVKLKELRRYSYGDGAYFVKHVHGTLPTDLGNIINRIAGDYSKGLLKIPIAITTATIQPFDTVAILFTIISVPIITWVKRRRKSISK